MTISRSSACWLAADWPAPANVQAGTSTRLGGDSYSPYDSLNVGDHVGDDLDTVIQNRQQLMLDVGSAHVPCWLKQVHGTRVVDASAHYHLPPEADASYSLERNAVCCVMTADCLPMLICDRAGTQVAAVHAGWRGLADGVIEATLGQLNAESTELLVWLGPAISQAAFEVGEEVRDKFISHDAAASQAFKPSRQGRWLADLYWLAKQRLAAKGINHVYGGEFCSYQDAQRFYSYRRDGVTGRMVSMIWLTR